jgi:Zn-dependent peptidase ImmA (M78 family)
MSNRAIEVAKQTLKGFEKRLPVDIQAIIQAHNIPIRTQPLEDAVSGILVVKNDHATIGVNESHHPNRQRFTLAHELGHFLLHSDSTNVFIDASPVFFRDKTSSEGSKLQEIEANAFAAELLMPEHMLRKITQNQPLDAFDEGAVRRLATQFGVSTQAMTIRLTKLGLIDG